MDWVIPYIGIPYGSKGEDRSCVDCWGLMRLIYQEQKGVTLPDFSGLYDDSNNAEQAAATIVSGIPSFTKSETPEVFDIIILRIMGWDCHCGLYLGEGRMIHSLEGHSAAIEDIDSHKWKDRIEGFYRWAKN